MPAIDLADLRPVLGSTDVLYTAIGVSSGPHLTPELFTTSGGKILCLTSAVTLKARRAREALTLAMCGWTDHDGLSLVGTVEVLDPAAPSTLLEDPTSTVLAPLGVAKFMLDNAAEMAGAALDVLAGRLGRPVPPHRVVLVVTPIAVTLTRDGEVVHASGWDVIGEAGEVQAYDGPGSHDIDLSPLPESLADLAASGSVAVGWLAQDGTPLALPARWDATTMEASVPWDAFDACRAGHSGPGCVTFDAWTGYGPSGKQGVMLRGEATVRREGSDACLAFRLDRASYWDGIETGTVEVGERA